MQIKAGWHIQYCQKCKKPFSLITHLGGRIKIKNCRFCKTLDQICYPCWEKKMLGEEKMKRKKVNVMGMDLMRFYYKSCVADVAEFEITSTLYAIKSEEPGQGHGTELLKQIQNYYKIKGKELCGSIALKDTMRHLYEKLQIKEYK